MWPKVAVVHWRTANEYSEMLLVEISTVFPVGKTRPSAENCFGAGRNSACKVFSLRTPTSCLVPSASTPRVESQIFSDKSRLCDWWVCSDEHSQARSPPSKSLYSLATYRRVRTVIRGADQIPQIDPARKLLEAKIAPNTTTLPHTDYEGLSSNKKNKKDFFQNSLFWHKQDCYQNQRQYFGWSYY